MLINISYIIEELNKIRCFAASELGNNLEKSELIRRCNETYDLANSLMQQLIDLKKDYDREVELKVPNPIRMS